MRTTNAPEQVSFFALKDTIAPHFPGGRTIFFLCKLIDEKQARGLKHHDLLVQLAEWIEREAPLTRPQEIALMIVKEGVKYGELR